LWFSIPTKDAAQSGKEMRAVEEESKGAIPNEDTAGPSSAEAPLNTKAASTSTAATAISATLDQTADILKPMSIEVSATTDSGTAIDSEATGSHMDIDPTIAASQSNPGGL
jgi:hypothetical protein